MQPAGTPTSIAPLAGLSPARAGSLHVDLPDIAALPYALTDLLGDAATSWTPERHGRDDASGRPGEAQALDCLTEAVYYEARSEPVAGQRAVAQVVLNRVGKRGFSNSVCGVVRQRTAGGTCQFNFNCDGAMAARRELRAWSAARDVAQHLLSGEVFALVGDATFYHRSDSRPDWAARFTRVATIGTQIFYRS